uniref:Uncharacterized protein n=1 Tax=Rhizophora mucronata TaxID=61149 RepID=A0A2P2P634_RHIMU
MPFLFFMELVSNLHLTTVWQIKKILMGVLQSHKWND